MNHHAQVVRIVDVQSYAHEETSATLVYKHFDKLGIDDVRDITLKAQLRPATNTGQVFIIATPFVTHEAQNALLKLFEEPPVDTTFVLVLPPAFQLLPTLQSRIGEEHVVINDIDNTAWDLFASSSYADRIKQIDQWQKSKDPQWLASMVTGIHNIKTKRLSIETTKAVQMVGQKLQTRGASNKMLLEHLALALPLRK